jgi:pimeloyl-ACP methyl ester carboxylesterase
MRWRSAGAALIAALSATAVLLGTAGPADALPGPPLQEPRSALERALWCSPNLAGAKSVPVLLVHGTFATSQWWTPTYRRALPTSGHPVCTVDVPDREAGDVQRSVEYVVHAIRAVAERAGRRIAVIGHSQGAFLVTFALRYWPDLGARVEDFVGLAGLYERGSALGSVLCADACPASAWQLRPGSRLLRAYASRHLYSGPDYTTISTAFDEFVVPQPDAGRLRGARNLALQDVCPGRLAEHGMITADAAAYALVLDAIEHPGPSDPARVGAAICTARFIPGTDVVGLAEQFALTAVGVADFLARPVGAEPPVRCPLGPGCQRQRLRPQLNAQMTASARARSVRVRGIVVLPPGALEQCTGFVRLRVFQGDRTLVAHRFAVGSDCRFTASLSLPDHRTTHGLRVIASFPGTSELRPVRSWCQLRRASPTNGRVPH